MDNVNFCNADGEDCEKLTGCERFGDICYVRQVVKIALAAGIILGVLCGTFSEKGHPTITVLQFLAMIAGIVAMGMWVDWSRRELGVDAQKLKLGLGGWLITIGWLLALLSMAVGWFDSRIGCIGGSGEVDQNGGLFHDKQTNKWISVPSRLGSLLSVTTWICLLVSVTNPEWTTVTNLGSAGMYNTTAVQGCTTNTAGEVLCSTGSGNATTSGAFGLWRYCISEVVPQFGPEPQQICVDWTDKIAITGSSSGDSVTCDVLADAGETAAQLAEDDAHSNDGCGLSGLERFADIGIRHKRTLTGFMVLASAGLAIIADVYSEKNFMGCVLMLLSCIAGIIAFASWLSFQLAIAGDGLTFGKGGWVLVGAWMSALASFFCYIIAYRSTLKGQFDCGIQLKLSGGKCAIIVTLKKKDCDLKKNNNAVGLEVADPHVTVLYRKEEFSQAELQEVIDFRDKTWMKKLKRCGKHGTRCKFTCRDHWLTNGVGRSNLIKGELYTFVKDARAELKSKLKCNKQRPPHVELRLRK